MGLSFLLSWDNRSILIREGVSSECLAKRLDCSTIACIAHLFGLSGSYFRMWNKSEANNSSPQTQSVLSAAFSSCAYASYVVAVSALMLILNSVLCLSAHSALTLFGPEWLMKNPVIQPRASQMFYFLAPVILMVLEWNLLDRIQRLFSAERA